MKDLALFFGFVFSFIIGSFLIALAFIAPAVRIAEHVIYQATISDNKGT